MKIVYIGGWMRSGTTLLCEMVGAFDEAIALGELSGIWRAAHRNEPCSCGEPIPRCPIWGAALAEVRVRHGVEQDDYAAMAEQVRRLLQTRHAHRLALLSAAKPGRWPPEVRAYVGVLHTLLRSVSDTSGAQVLVDSSKLPPGFLLERLMPDTTVDVVHIVRDPRAVANSERKTRIRSGPDADLLPPGRSAAQSVVYWSGFNAAVKAYSGRADTYLTVDYSALTSNTESELDRIAAGLGVGRTSGKLLEGGHIAVGNPARFQGNGRAVRADDSWKRELPQRDRILVSSIGLPGRMLFR